MYNYDPELPAGLQDADLETGELTRQANREARLRRLGICTHSGHGPVVIGEPARRCYDCGAVFKDEVELEVSRRNALAQHA